MSGYCQRRLVHQVLYFDINDATLAQDRTEAERRRLVGPWRMTREIIRRMELPSQVRVTNRLAWHMSAEKGGQNADLAELGSRQPPHTAIHRLSQNGKIDLWVEVCGRETESGGKAFMKNMLKLSSTRGHRTRMTPLRAYYLPGPEIILPQCR
jgi:hypothetical protein